MLFQIYVLRLEGAVNKTFAVVPATDYRVENSGEEDEKRIIEVLRYDREANLHGFLVPETNPSLDPATVKFYYTPTMGRQRLYSRGLPVDMGTYEIVDAFVCLGSRFGLKPLQVFVELCHSFMGGNRYWANIYYVSDAELPEAVIRIEQHSVDLDSNEVEASLSRDKAALQRLRSLSEQ